MQVPEWSIPKPEDPGSNQFFNYFYANDRNNEREVGNDPFKNVSPLQLAYICLGAFDRYSVCRTFKRKINEGRWLKLNGLWLQLFWYWLWLFGHWLLLFRIWLLFSCKSGCFWNQRSGVRIKSSANFICYQLY